MRPFLNRRSSRCAMATRLMTAGALVALAACGQEGSPSGTPAAPTSSASGPSSGVPTGEPSPGWDESPDGTPPVPDAGLSDAEVTTLLRTQGPTAGAEACGPDDVSVSLEGFDVAAGSRFSSVVVTNTSSRTCAVTGVPGLGVRGEWGNRFEVAVEEGHTRSGESSGPIRLAPDERAASLLQWTGNLAANGDERASMLAVQLADGQAPLRVDARIVLPDYEEIPDIGMTTTVRVGPFEALG